MCRRVLTQTGLPAGHRTARGALRSTLWELWESFWVHSGDHFRFEFIPNPFKSFSPVRRPWGPASGAFGAESNAGLGLGKLYGGRGLGLTGGPHLSTLVPRIGGFMMGKWRISLCRRVLPQTGLPAAHRTARGALWSTSWELWESFWIHSGDHFRSEFIRTLFRSFSRSQFADPLEQGA